MNYGGPVWHVSVHCQRGPVNPGELQARALLALNHVGDVDHEWIDFGGLDGRTVHYRRRTLETELPASNLRDIRGTDEAQRRLTALRSVLPPKLWTVIGDW